MSRNSNTPPSSPTAIITDKRPPITQIKISNCNNDSKITTKRNFQNDNINEEDY